MDVPRAASPPAPIRHKKKKPNAEIDRNDNASIKQWLEVLDWQRPNGSKQARTLEYFRKKYPSVRMSQPALSVWVKNESEMRKRYEADVSQHELRRSRTSKHDDINEALAVWVQQAVRDEVVISGAVLRKKWADFARLKQLPEVEWLKLSDGWVAAFKDRLNLRQHVLHGEASSASMELVIAERDRLKKELADWAPENIYNEDETGLYYA